MSWGFSPPTGLALGRSPFRSNPFLEGGGSAGSTNESNGGGGSGINNGQGGRGDGDWTFLDERATSAPSTIIPPPSLAQERRRSMSLDIPQSIPQQQHHYPPPPLHHHQHHQQHQNRHRSSSSSCSPSGASRGGRTSNLTRDLSGLNVRERGESAGLPIRGGSSSSSSEGSESAIQRQYRSRLEEADQQTAYWQARAKEAEQAILKYKQECVTLRCQLSGKQCTLNSLDEVMGSIVNRLESVLGNLGIRLEVMSPSSPTNQPEDEGAGVVGGLARELERKKSQSQARPLLLGRIEMGLQELEQRVGQGRGGHVSPSSSFHLPKDSVINFRRLAAGDLALFFPTPAGDYLAFNVGCPHHYLSEASKAMIGQDKHFRKYYVLGRITKLEKHQAPPRPSSLLDNERNASSMLDGRVVGGATDPAGGSNNKGSKASTYPSNLSAGCKYTIVHVEPIGDAHHQQSPQLKGLNGPPIKTL